jgi:hypothetical protein
MDVCVVFVVKTVVWNVKWHEGRKDLNSTKMDQRGKKTPDRQKKIHLGHGCLSLVIVVCCQVEVSATSWSLVQRSPTECDMSNVCDREASKKKWGGQGPQGAVEPLKKTTNELHYFSVFLSLHMFWHSLCHPQCCRRGFTIFNASNSLSQRIIHYQCISLIFLFMVVSLSSFVFY